MRNWLKENLLALSFLLIILYMLMVSLVLIKNLSSVTHSLEVMSDTEKSLFNQ